MLRFISPKLYLFSLVLCFCGCQDESCRTAEAADKQAFPRRDRAQSRRKAALQLQERQPEPTAEGSQQSREKSTQPSRKTSAADRSVLSSLAKKDSSALPTPTGGPGCRRKILQLLRKSRKRKKDIKPQRRPPLCEAAVFFTSGRVGAARRTGI